MPDQPTPLEALIQYLRARRLPSIGTLIGMIEENQYYADFVHLVKDYLPEREREIIDEPGPERQMAKFADYFEDRYFPLPQYFKFGEAEEYYDLVKEVPLIALGFGYQDYDDLVQNGNAGVRLMTYFFQQPYGEQGARVALAEGCREHLPAELLQRIPELGFTPEQMHKLLDGTPYAPLATWGDMINLSTGNNFLDTDEEMMSNSVLPDWSKENVKYFTREWAEAQQKQQTAFEMADKFENKPRAYFQEVMDFITKRREDLNGTDANQGTDALPVGHARQDRGAS